MRAPKTALIPLLVGIVLLLLALCIPLVINLWPHRFMHKSDAFYSEFTRACDSLLAQRHFGTNEVEEISTTDVSLPKIIRNMRPRRVELRPHGVWMQIGESRADGFGILWKQDDIQTNIWNLTVAGESLHRVLYTTNKQQAAVR